MRTLARDTDGLLFSIEGPDDLSQLQAVLDRFRSLSADGGPFWKCAANDGGEPLFATVRRSKLYVIFTRNEDGSLGRVVKFTEHALAGAVADPPSLAGRGPDGKHRWGAAAAEQMARHACRGRVATGANAFASPWDSRDGEPFPVLTRLQAAIPEHLIELAPRLSLKPFGCYVRIDADRAFSDRGSFVALDPGTDLAEWRSLDWRGEDGAHGDLTTTVGDPSRVTVTSLATRTQRWMKAKAKQAPRPVLVGAFRRAGRAGPDAEAQVLDPSREPNALRVFYEDETGRSVQQMAADLGPRAFARASEMSRSAAHRLARTGTPTRATVRRALAGLERSQETVRSCSCGRPITRPNQDSCSPACKQRAYRLRKQGQRRSA